MLIQIYCKYKKYLHVYGVRGSENEGAVSSSFLSRTGVSERRKMVWCILAFLNLSKHKILHLETGNTSHTQWRRRLCPRHSDVEIDLSVVMDRQLKRRLWSCVSAFRPDFIWDGHRGNI